jgi:prevent-host-death family protein
MKIMSITNDIIPIGKFKTNLSKWFESVQKSGHPLVITQNGKPAGVLLSPSEYDEMVYKQAFLDSIKKGIDDADSGNVYDTDKLKAELAKRRERG